MKKYKSWVEVSKDNLVFNISGIRRRVDSKVKILSVVKANAYGHGLKEVSEVIKDMVDWFGVDNIDEALEIRSFNIENPILVLGYIPVERLKEAAENNISVAFYNKKISDDSSSLNFRNPLRVHLKIETGMNRQGILEDDLAEFVDRFKSSAGKLLLEGVYTHFSDTDDIGFMDYQFDRFIKSVEVLKQGGFGNLIRHCCASAGMLTNKKYHLDMVRTGISQYGYWSSANIKKRVKKIKLKPVLSWKTIVAQVKHVEMGGFVGYGRTWIAKRKSKIAIAPIGYYDGFDRRFSNNGVVLIGGKRAGVIGGVAMNMFTIDVTDLGGVVVGDEVAIIGKQGSLEILADELAQRLGTISYEVLCRINPILPRIVV